MPLITLAGLVAAGKPLLDTKNVSQPDDSYTADLHSTRIYESLTGKSGLMSTANGNLDTDNFGRVFRLGAEHIMPEQASLARKDYMLESSALYGNGIGARSAPSWVTIGGTSIRWYQPYATTVSLLQWSLFVSHNNWQGAYRDASETKGHHKTRIEIRCVLDGEYIENSNRRFGENMFHPVAPGYRQNDSGIGPGRDEYDGSYNEDIKVTPFGGNPQYVWGEAHSAVPIDLHYPTALSKGFHEISVQCRMQSIGGEAVMVQNMGKNGRTNRFRGRGYFELTSKLCVGIRNARVLSLL